VAASKPGTDAEILPKEAQHAVPYKEKSYERKSTDSRWNILMAIKRAAEA